jgi:Xaa-Pro aminopeptidase
MNMSTISQRLATLRGAMQQGGMAACIVPTADPHLSEYLPAHWQAREWLSGFTGSAGTLIVTGDFAGLWTDSRYFSQAERQLAESGVALMKLNVPHTPEHVAWLCEQMHEGDKVACAADMLSLASERGLRQALAKPGAQLVEDDLPGAVWNDRPPLPPRRCRTRRCTRTRSNTPFIRAPTSSPTCARQWPRVARRTMSCPHSTRSPGS